MKKVIVTGSNGFLGTALCKELSSRGINVIAIVRNKQENISEICNLPNLKIIYCDMSDFYKLHELIIDRDIDVLYHFAWVGSSGQLRGNWDVQVNNIKYTCQTVLACSALNCKRFVFAASIMENEITTFMESSLVPNINSLYSSAKIAADYMARTIAGSMGIKFIRALISNIYGPGEYSPRLINTSIRKMLSGEHCAFSLGNQIYDFIYITDAVRSFIALGEKGIANRTYYIGSLNPRPLKEFLVAMRDTVNPNLELRLGEINISGTPANYNEIDIEALKNDTGVVPKVSFTEGIVNTAKWIKENM